jgi:hypothetical protein
MSFKNELLKSFIYNPHNTSWHSLHSYLSTILIFLCSRFFFLFSKKRKEILIITVSIDIPLHKMVENDIGRGPISSSWGWFGKDCAHLCVCTKSALEWQWTSVKITLNAQEACRKPAFDKHKSLCINWEYAHFTLPLSNIRTCTGQEFS